GWGRDDPEVKPAVDALANATDPDLDDLAALLPDIMPDKASARERLIRMGMRREVRRDLLTNGFEACGCDAADDEAVAAILAFPPNVRSAFDASRPLFGAFSAHPKVRALAV